MHPQSDQTEQKRGRLTPPSQGLTAETSHLPVHILAAAQERLAAPPRPPADQQATDPTADQDSTDPTADQDAEQPADQHVDDPPATDPPADQRAADLREQLEAVRLGAAAAASWLESSRHYAALLNGDGFVPVTARFDAQDLAFLGSAREQLLRFAELGLRLAELHQPLDAGGITTDPASPILRCRSCMWRWPCPTFRVMSEVLDDL